MQWIYFDRVAPGRAFPNRRLPRWKRQARRARRMLPPAEYERLTDRTALLLLLLVGLAGLTFPLLLGWGVKALVR